MIAAVLSTGGGLLHHIVRTGSATRLGTAASSSTFHGRTYIGGVGLDAITSTYPLGLVAHFPRVAAWGGQDTIDQDYEASDDGRMTSVILRLPFIDDQCVVLSDGRELTLRSDWHLTGPSHHRAVVTRLAVGCTSDTPQPVEALLRPLVAAQDLLSLAHDEPIVASTGSATMDYRNDGHPRASSWLWSASLMERHPAFAADEEEPLPLFSLDAVGGIEGVGRWVALSERHPRATSPTVRRYRQGHLSPSVALMEVAAGIEYWVRANEKEPWAGKTFAQDLADYVGSPFARWVGGDPARWGAKFWDTYNAVKHRPADDRPPMIVGRFAESGRWLLAAGLLCHIAETNRPAEQIFDGGLLTQLGRRLREVMAADLP